MALNTTQLQAMLHDILNKTCNGDHRSIAQDHIVQLSIRNMTNQERKNIESFISKAMKEIDITVAEEIDDLQD